MNHLRSQRGQFTVEAVLILTIMVGVFTLLHREISKRQLLNSIVSGPWSHIAGMIESGVWVPAEGAKTYHPNVFGRRASPEPQ